MTFSKALMRYEKIANLGVHVLLQVSQVRGLGVAGFARWHATLLDAYLRDRKNRSAYRVLDEAELRATRKSDTVFIFGSGYSLHDISDKEWRYFEEHDTLGLSGFIYQQWVRVDYHLVRGWVESKEGSLNWMAHTQDFADTLNANPYFNSAILIMQGEYLAQFCNALVGYRFLRPGTRLFRYTTIRGSKYPSRRLKEGLCHTVGTLSDAVNFAYCAGWKHLVLVGVDLYDSRYFWLKADETLALDKATGKLIPSQINTRGLRFDQVHNTVRNGMVEQMGQWRAVFEREGVTMSVYNPHSLLAQVMPVHDRSLQACHVPF